MSYASSGMTPLHASAIHLAAAYCRLTDGEARDKLIHFLSPYSKKTNGWECSTTSKR
ncbi:MAG: hypothetical protein Q8909_10975 [Bacteroidota bacterium]|nr:hypothetical protein [Bacteroidota bacterium]